MSTISDLRVGDEYRDRTPKRALVPGDSWWPVAATGTLLTAALAVVVWVSGHLTVSPAVHTTGLFLHLASLVLGFGGVMIADYMMLRWLFGRSTFAEAVQWVSRLHAPIWTGLAGLVISGIVLEPNLASTFTRTKMVMVLILTLNGLQSSAILSKRLAQRAGVPPTARLLAWGLSSALISQICWWGAIVIGFRNAQH
jgi:hypothetical protein